MKIMAAVMAKPDGAPTHRSTQFEEVELEGPDGKTLTGVGGQAPGFLLAVMKLHRDGRFPLDRFVRRHRSNEVNQALATATPAPRSSRS